MSNQNQHIGSSLDEFLEDEGLLESSQSFAIKRVLAWQILQIKKGCRIHLKFEEMYPALFIDG